MFQKLNKKKISISISIILILIVLSIPNDSNFQSKNSPTKDVMAENNILEESDSPLTSQNKKIWLNSGAIVHFDNNLISTIQGDLALGSKWQTEYANTNPTDSDNGLHPQNLLRLFYMTKYDNFTEEAYFKINKTNLSKSENRNTSNGILLISHCLDNDNLYYAGLRVDGQAVIKSKKKGIYKTISEKTIFPGTYDSMIDPNLIPANTWIGLRLETSNVQNNIKFKLYIDENNSGNFHLVLEGTDNSLNILKSGYTGIRTDFMDIECKDRKISQL